MVHLHVGMDPPVRTAPKVHTLRTDRGLAVHMALPLLLPLSAALRSRSEKPTVTALSPTTCTGCQVAHRVES